MAQVVGLLERVRIRSARSVKAIMTATYWEIGRRIAEQEQRGEKRAQYGKALLRRLAEDLTPRFGRGFSERNLLAMREFYRARWNRLLPFPFRGLTTFGFFPSPTGKRGCSVKTKHCAVAGPSVNWPADRDSVLRAHPAITK